MEINQNENETSLVLLKHGAEARVFESIFVGKRSVVKERFSKKYRHPTLDSKLTLKRLSAEARCMTKERRLGVLTPVLYDVDPVIHTLTSEFGEGPAVKDVFLDFGLNRVSKEQIDDIATQIGGSIGKLHDGGLIHGDLTTGKNLNLTLHIPPAFHGSTYFDEARHVLVICSNFQILVDFGLSFTSSLPEDKAVDLYVLERALISMHSSCGNAMDQILAGYRNLSKQWASTLNKLAQGLDYIKRSFYFFLKTWVFLLP